MALSDMQIFEEYAYGAATETITQQVDLFNAASRGAITLVPANNEGDYSSETFWKNIPGLIRRRDAYGTGPVAEVALEQDATTSVKVAGGTPPITFTPAQMTWIQKSPEEAGVVIGEQLGVGMTADYINSAIRVGQAAITNLGDAATVTATDANIARGGLVDASAKFGDRSSSIAVWVMHSKVMHDLYAENVTNTNRLFDIGAVNLMEDGFGRLLLMTDAPDLVTAGSPNTYATLGLTEGAISIEDNGDLFANVETSNGGENIIRSMQSEYTFNAKVKGFAWDKANGGASPNDAALATGSNWDQVATSVKDTAGVALLTR